MTSIKRSGDSINSPVEYQINIELPIMSASVSHAAPTPHSRQTHRMSNAIVVAPINNVEKPRPLDPKIRYPHDIS